MNKNYKTNLEIDSFVKKIGIWFILFFVLVLVVINMFIVIPSGFVWVKSLFWKINTDELKPWLHIIFPIWMDVLKVNVKVKTINYKWQNDLVDDIKDGIINKPSINVLDSRWLPINIELTVLYQLQSDQSAETIIKYGVKWDEKLINPTIREVVRDILWNYTAETIPEKRTEIWAKIKDELLEKFKNSAIIIQNVQLRNIKLPITVEQKILQVQEAKQEAEKQKYLLEKAKVEAQTKKAQAEWLAQAQIARAKWEAESIKLKAQAQAQANQELSKSITNELIEYEKAKKWNWMLPNTLVNWEKSWLFMNITK